MKTLLQKVSSPATRPTVKPVPKQVRRTVKTLKKRGHDSTTIQITTTRPMLKIIDTIQDTGLFGTSRAQACERIMCEGVRIILKENPFIRIKKILI